MTAPNVNVINVTDVSPEDLSRWIVSEILSSRLPDVNINSAPTIDELYALMPQITNHVAFVTELYVLCVGAKAKYSVERKHTGTKSDAADKVTFYTASMEILYSTLKALEARKDACGRMMTKLLSSKYTSVMPNNNNDRNPTG